MTQIVPNLLWLGHAGEGRDFRALFGAGIRAVVELAAEELPSQPPRDLVYCRFPLIDGEGNDSALLLLAMQTVATMLTGRIPTLVCCGAGLSRSPAIAAAALACTQNEPLNVCLERVTKHHPADVSPALWHEITELSPHLRS